MANITIVLGLLSVITSTVRQIDKREDDAVAAGEEVWTGEFKLALALGIIEAVYTAANPTGVPFDKFKGTLISTINTIVAVFHSVGEFTRKKA